MEYGDYLVLIGMGMREGSRGGLRAGRRGRGKERKETEAVRV